MERIWDFIQEQQLLQLINMKVAEPDNQWKTNNQSYGQHVSKGTSQSQQLKQKFAVSTLDQLKRDDQSGYVHQQENIAQRERHGLFTQPPWLSLGDQYHDKKPDECKKNVGVNPHLLDNVQPELFSRLGSTNLGDPYKDGFRAKQLYDKEKVDLIPHGQPFLGTHNKKLVKHSEYEHMKEYGDKVFDTRDEAGNVKVGKKNFSTNPMKKGYGASTTGHLFGEYPYQGNPYDLPRELETKQRAEHKANIPEPFVGASHTNQVFTPDYAVHMNDKNEPYQPKKDEKSQPKYGPWRATNPAKKGYNKTFQRFPQYIEEGEKPRRPVSHQAPWIYNFNGTSKYYGETLAKPSPVPSQMVLNDIRRSKA